MKKSVLRAYARLIAESGVNVQKDHYPRDFKSLASASSATAAD